MASNVKVDIVRPTATNGSLSLKGDSGGSATTNGVTVNSSGNTSITGTTTVSSLVATTADINGGTIDGADITVGSGKTLDVSAGTLTLANDQISGDKVEGGTIAATTITALTSTTINAGDGSAATPSITNTGDTNTGIYFPAADTVGVSTNGSERMRIDSSGNVELKTTSANLILPSGGGISFPDATQINSATDDNATLSTYETGYVPNPIYVGGTQYNLNSAEDQLHYIRIGDLVYLAGEIDSFLATNTATGAITLKLPFTSASSAGGNFNTVDNGQRAYVGSTAYSCSITIPEGATEASVREGTSFSDFSVTINQRVLLNLSFCYYAA